MENQNRDTENELTGNRLGQENGSVGKDLKDDISGSKSLNGRPASSREDESPDEGDTDKYLAMEQPGVSYTPDADPMAHNSDHADFGEVAHTREWNDEGGNSKNSDAFNQDDYLLEDNLDLDEDQNKSISSDDEDFEEANERY